MNISTKNDTTKDKIIISPVSNKILKIWDTFWAHTNISTMQQKLFQKFLPQKVVAFGNNTEKEPQMPRPKLKKYV